MIKPDVIVTWPRSADYPLWRWIIRQNRERYNNIHIVFMETNYGYDYRNFIRSVMFPDNVRIHESPAVEPGQDWRNVAVNHALSEIEKDPTSSTHVMFTEQDFFPMPGFWEHIEEQKNVSEIFGMFVATRLHPACIIVPREVVNKTRKNFGIDPGRVDHFGLFQEDIVGLALPIAPIREELCVHMAGLSHNMSLVERQEAPNHQVPQFIEYIKGCLNAPVPLDNNWKNIYQVYADK